MSDLEASRNREPPYCKTRASRFQTGGSVILPRALAPDGFALAEACAADHFVLERVIGKGTLDGIAGTLGLVPQGFHLASSTVRCSASYASRAVRTTLSR